MIETKSIFYYGITITKDNNLIPFSEGGPEIIATVKVGSYTHSQFINEISKALNAVSLNNYVVSLDRDNRKITIAGDSNFELLCNTSLLSSNSPYLLMGFDVLSDKTGSNNYQSENSSGSEYKPQYFLQSYSPFSDNVEVGSASINETAMGIVEVISYGRKYFMSCNIRFANNSQDNCDDSPFEYNPSGYSDLITFMNYLIDKKPIEFMANADDRSEFDSCILESSSSDSKGTKFSLKELLREGLKNHYETGIIKFRRI
jgi:hypothetical protein